MPALTLPPEVQLMVISWRVEYIVQEWNKRPKLASRGLLSLLHAFPYLEDNIFTTLNELEKAACARSKAVFQQISVEFFRSPSGVPTEDDCDRFYALDRLYGFHRMEMSAAMSLPKDIKRWRNKRKQQLQIYTVDGRKFIGVYKKPACS